jgi:hypothetical protein
MEGNSCYHGGQPWVSDVFASALWAADYLLRVAQAGYAGVNLHGGGEGYYAPITGEPNAAQLRPQYYAMGLAQRFAGATFVSVAPRQCARGDCLCGAHGGRDVGGAGEQVWQSSPGEAARQRRTSVGMLDTDRVIDRSEGRRQICADKYGRAGVPAYAAALWKLPLMRARNG